MSLLKIRGDRVSMIFQDPMTSLNPYLTVARQLTEVSGDCTRTCLPHFRLARKAIEMLERVGITRNPADGSIVTPMSFLEVCDSE